MQQVLLPGRIREPLRRGCVHGPLDRGTTVHISIHSSGPEGDHQNLPGPGKCYPHCSLVAPSALVCPSTSDGHQSLSTPEPPSSAVPPQRQDTTCGSGLPTSHSLGAGPSIMDALNWACRPSILATYARMWKAFCNFAADYNLPVYLVGCSSEVSPPPFPAWVVTLYA